MQNKNVLLITDKINKSNQNIKKVNYNYNSNKTIYNKYNKNYIISTNDNFYTKKANEILNGDNLNTEKNRNISSNKINLSIENNNLNLINKTHSNIYNIYTSNSNSAKKKSKNLICIKKNITKIKEPKKIFSKCTDKKITLPIKKYNNKNTNINNNRNISKKKEEKERSSQNSKKKYCFIQKSSKSDKNNKNGLNNYINNTYGNEQKINDNKNKIIIQSLKYKVLSNTNNKLKEIKKSQSQSQFKYKINKGLNTAHSKYNNYNESKAKNKFKSKNHQSISYKGIIINRKNMIKNKMTKSSSNHDSKPKKNRVVCINYNKKYLNSTSIKNNKMSNNNYNYFMNNLPDEYNKDQLFLRIKKLWNKLKVSYTYQEMFIILTDKKEYKKQIYTNEINSLSLILNYLNNLNENIKKRDEVINKIKSFNNYNNIEEIQNFLHSLRLVSLDVVCDYILFMKEISYNVLTNKFNLDDIKNFNKNYLNIMKNDTSFLYYHNNLNKMFYFSKKSDPFLIYPSLKIPKNNNENKYIILPIDAETLEKINKCEYFLLTEKICQYSLCNNKSNINYLLFSDQDNIINSIINSDTINISNSNFENNNMNNSYYTNKNKDNISPFSTPINKIKNFNNNNKTTNNTSKYEKFCYINKISNNENKQKKKDIQISNNNQINSKNTNSNKFNDMESDKNNSFINNSNDKKTSSIPIKIQTNYSDRNDNNKTIPYIPNTDISLSSIYSSYLSLVPENMKKSFNINEDIFYYANIGIYPKIIFFKDSQNLKIKGICTISFNQTINLSIMNINKSILTITSISCINGEKISNILLNLIDFCKNEEIIYDSIEINLFYIKKENGNFILDKELEKEIKLEAKFNWVRLENDGEKRKIKYHYIPHNILIDKDNSILNNLHNNHYNMNNNNKYAIYINNYVLIKFYQDKGINDISMTQFSKLYFIINLLNKYFILKDNNNNEKDINKILINLKGLKLQKIVRILSEYNNVLLTNDLNFQNDYLSNETYNSKLLNSFLEIIEKNKNENNNLEKNICLNINKISTNFSNILKIDIDGYEYNIISMNDFIIEVFNIETNNNNELIYFTKSETENISFIFYEQNENINEKDDNNIKLLFNKILNKILIKDNEEPIKSYKKIGIPSFSYKNKIIEDKNEKNDKLKIIEYDLMDCNECFDFCIEKIPNYNIKFSFPLNENYFGKEEVKIIKNNFIIAILNPDLVLDYQIPSMNIYYINKECWKKTNKNNSI